MWRSRRRLAVSVRVPVRHTLGPKQRWPFAGCGHPPRPVEHDFSLPIDQNNEWNPESVEGLVEAAVVVRVGPGVVVLREEVGRLLVFLSSSTPSSTKPLGAVSFSSSASLGKPSTQGWHQVAQKSRSTACRDTTTMKRSRHWRRQVGRQARTGRSCRGRNGGDG